MRALQAGSCFATHGHPSLLAPALASAFASGGALTPGHAALYA